MSAVTVLYLSLYGSFCKNNSDPNTGKSIGTVLDSVQGSCYDHAMAISSSGDIFGGPILSSLPSL